MYKKNVQGWMKHIDFILLDLLCLNIAFVAAWMTRHGFNWPYQDEAYVRLAFVITLVGFVVHIVNDTMKNVLRRGFYVEMTATLKHIFLVETITISYLFATKESEIYSRVALGSFPIYYLLLSYVLRLLWKRHLRSQHRVSNTAMYLITTSDRVDDLADRYLSECFPRYQMKGICLLDVDRVGEAVRDIPVNTCRETVLQYLCREWVDEVVISVSPRYASSTDLVDALAQMGIVVHIEVEDASIMGWKRQEVEKLCGKTVLTIGLSMVTPSQVFLKRAVDIAGALVGCLLTLVLTLTIGPLIYLQSPGPIFFSQTRVGKNGKQFKLYKFRSMYPDAEARKAELMDRNRVESGLMFKLDYDPRIIGSRQLPDGTVKKGIGNFIRDWSLDEFPQFWNVLKGDLSLVGTRPPTVDEWERYELHHRARLAIKPGITGLWQVSGRSKITDFEQVVKLDTKYIRQWSMGLDFRIILQTIKVVLRRDGSM